MKLRWEGRLIRQRLNRSNFYCGFLLLLCICIAVASSSEVLSYSFLLIMNIADKNKTILKANVQLLGESAHSFAFRSLTQTYRINHKDSNLELICFIDVLINLFTAVKIKHSHH